MVNASLAVELYLKTLMIAGRNGRVTKGHDLAFLYAQFPHFLRQAIEFQYAGSQPWRSFTVHMIGLTMRDTPPQSPQTPTPVPPFGTFPLAMQSLGRTFEVARYFFEDVSNSDWAIFAYCPGAVEAAISALDSTYETFRTGGFVGHA